MGAAEIRIAPMDRYEAEQITGRIRMNFDENYRLIKQIRDREGFLALGFDSIEAWGARNFGQTPRHIDRMLTAAMIAEHIENGPRPIGLGDISEGTLRPLTALLREGRGEHSRERPDAREKINEAISKAVEQSNGKPTAAHVAAANRPPGTLADELDRAEARTRAALLGDDEADLGPAYFELERLLSKYADIARDRLAATRRKRSPVAALAVLRRLYIATWTLAVAASILEEDEVPAGSLAVLAAMIRAVEENGIGALAGLNLPHDDV